MKILTTLLFFLLVWSCTKEVDYRFNYPGDGLAVMARIDPAEGIEVYVTQIVPPQGTFNLDDLVISQAKVTVTDRSGAAYAVPYVGDARYFLPPDSTINTSSQYRLEVIHQDFDTVRSDWVTIPTPPSEASIVRRIRLDTNTNLEVSDLRVSSTDPAGVNYYLVEVYANGEDNRPQFQLQLTADFDSEFCELYNYHPPHAIFFRDLCFRSQNFELVATVDERSLARFTSPPLSYDSYTVALRHISSIYFDFQLDRLNLDDTRGTILEPKSPSTSNLTGGYGVFLASSSMVKVFSVQ